MQRLARILPPGARESWIGGDTYGHELGRVGDVYANAGQSSMSAFLAQQYPDILPYHAWVGYSNNTATMDQQYHCLDFYWQSPQEYLTGSYDWFLSLDVSDPSDFYLSVVYKRVGIKSMKDPERPNYIAEPTCKYVGLAYFFLYGARSSLAHDILPLLYGVLLVDVWLQDSYHSDLLLVARK